MLAVDGENRHSPALGGVGHEPAARNERLLVGESQSAARLYRSEGRLKAGYADYAVKHCIRTAGGALGDALPAGEDAGRGVGNLYFKLRGSLFIRNGPPCGVRIL